jgi:transposase
MKLHANAALSWSGRRLVAERVLVDGWTLRAAAEAGGVSVRCAGRWVSRYRGEGEQGLADRSSAPRHVANRTPADRVAVIVLLRRLRMTAAEIAETVSMPLSTVSAILKRQGLGRLGRIGLERRSATNARGLASSSTSTSRSSAESAASAIASPAAGRARPRRGSTVAGPASPAGSTSMSPSTWSAPASVDSGGQAASCFSSFIFS